MKRNVLLGSISVMHEVWLPYAAGALYSHVSQHADICERYEFLPPLYKYQAIEQLRPQLETVDLLALTCYSWNQTFCHEIAKGLKAIKPSATVIFGGPNIPRDPKLQLEFAQKHDCCDLFFVGPGENNLLSFLRLWLDTCPLEIPSTFGIAEGRFFRNEIAYDQLKEDQLPNPYSSDFFSPILRAEPSVKASFESNRGCPYKCSFCDWGGTAGSKITKFTLNDVWQVLEYITQIKNISEIEILDANFGMFPRDLEIIEKIAHLKQQTQNPFTVSYSGLAKNGSPYLAPILNIIHEKLSPEQRHLKLSFQTHAKETLEIAQRKNIDNQKLSRVLDGIDQTRIQVSAEMIIGLPGETAESWLYSLTKNFEYGIENTRTYLLNLSYNTDLYTESYQKRYQIRSKRLLFPYTFTGMRYKDLLLNKGPRTQQNSDKAYESLEVIYQCFSYDLDELSVMFDYWWFYHNMINAKALTGTLKQICGNGSYSLGDLIRQFFSHLSKFPLLHSLVERNRQTVQRLFAPEMETLVSRLEDYFFACRSLRQDDIYQIWLNQDTFYGEIYAVLKACGLRNFDSALLNDHQRVKPLSSGSAEWKTIKQFFGTDANLSARGLSHV